ncbi:MAG TPA: hypothetical protein VJ877_07155 [Bacteroidales bacterium]|nr:hypothetical protein [Bacteroidales bacterium]
MSIVMVILVKEGPFLSAPGHIIIPLRRKESFLQAASLIKTDALISLHDSKL